MPQSLIQALIYIVILAAIENGQGERVAPLVLGLIVIHVLHVNYEGLKMFRGIRERSNRIGLHLVKTGYQDHPDNSA